MELRNLRAFKAVSEYLNITKAADFLGYTQPTVTTQIKILEKEIGQPLFTRVGKQTFLTPTGKMMKVHVDKILTHVEEMEKELKKLKHFQGKLVIASPEFYCTHYLSAILKAYLQLHPEINIKLISCNSIDATKMVSENEADIAVIAGRCHLSEMESTIIGSEDLVLVAASEIAKDRDITYLLEKYPFLIDNNIGPISDHLHLFDELRMEPKLLMECNSEETIKRAVVNGTGICILGSANTCEEIENGKLTMLHRFSKRLDTSIIYLEDREKETVIQTFSELVKDIWDTVREESDLRTC
ncbi:LysR family transcriptional regulator [Metabacillus fastidiosus]|uniref:LysR family transcriptional regulator n=1 Tax=Metabacillus fastidiosus TaxID=1458 RepID=UPI003D2AADDC